MSTIPWSAEQQLIFSFQRQPNGNGMVSAGAGTGKTTVIKGLMELLNPQETVLYLAFNRNIVADIEKSLQSGDNGFNIRCQYQIRTFHGFCFSAIKRVAKYRNIEKDDNKEYMVEDAAAKEGTKVPQHAKGAVRQLWHIARFSGYGYSDSGLEQDAKRFTREEWMALIKRYNVDEYIPADLRVSDLYDQMIEAVKAYLRIGYQMCQTVVDFDDMIWFALVCKKVRDVMPRFDYVYVDECQDMNFVRREILRYCTRTVGRKGRLMFVGDRYQAINGFAGADYDSMDLAKSIFKCTELPLNTTRRCGLEIVKYAQTWVPHYTAAVGNHEGEVLITDMQLDTFDLDPVNDMVLCRNNRPLIQVFFTLVKAGIPAIILGNDLAKKLAKLADEVCDDLDLDSGRITGQQFAKKLTMWKEEKIDQLMKDDRRGLAGYIHDMAGGLQVIIAQHPGIVKLPRILESIERMFMDEEGKRVDRVVLSSIHKAKGRERNRVFWIGKNQYQPSKFARSAEELQQEENLMYVAATRAKHSLVIIDVEKGEYD